MESAFNMSGGHGITSTCPVTGLPVYTRSDWLDVKLGSNYYMSVSIVGERILMGKITGESDLTSVISATRFMNRVIHEAFGADKKFVYVEDFTELKNLTTDCKKYYMKFLESQKQMMALIICTVSPLIMLAIRLSSRLKLVKYNGMVEKDIPSALKRAVEILNSERKLKGPEIDSIPRLSCEKVRCPVSGMTLTEKTEWTRMDLGGPAVTFRFIGNRILHTEFHGWISMDTELFEKFQDKRERVLSAMLAPVEPYVEIRNYKGVDHRTFMRFNRNMRFDSREDKKRVLKSIAYNIPKLPLAALAIRRMGKLTRGVTQACGDYDQALKTAVNTLKSKGYTHEGTRNVTTRKEWGRNFGDYSVAFEVIDSNVVHRVSLGRLRIDNMDEVFELQAQVLESTGLHEKPHYFLQGLKEIEGLDLKTRKTYFKKWSEFIENRPHCQMNVMYGGDRTVRAGLSISSYLRPMKIHISESPEEAIQWITTDKEKNVPCEKRPGGLPQAVEMDKIKIYADELIYFLGNINWEVDGFDSDLVDIEPDHPFKLVYDAISLVKMDIDDLFREREKNQSALIQSEEIARALLNATSDSSLLISSDGTILSANETFARRFGRSPSSLRHENITGFLDAKLTEHRMMQIKKVVLTGKPVRFEDEDAESERHYDNTIYPVFGADGRVDRLALYTRDITDAKKAEKHIQVLTQEIIKAQENERQRIARDLHDNVAQDLASLIISSDTLFEGFQEIPHEVRRRTMKFSKVLKRAISSIRDLAYDLRPPSLDQLGLVRTLAQYCTEFTESNRISVDFYSAGLDKLDLDFDTEINLYRLIQEALNNVRKHSGATLVTIRLVASFPEIILRIEDDGNGFDPEFRIAQALNEKRMGLKSMEERVKLLKGEFSIRSRGGEGTMILVKLPYSHGLESWKDSSVHKGETGMP